MGQRLEQREVDEVTVASQSGKGGPHRSHPRGEESSCAASPPPGRGRGVAWGRGARALPTRFHGEDEAPGGSKGVGPWARAHQRSAWEGARGAMTREGDLELPVVGRTKGSSSLPVTTRALPYLFPPWRRRHRPYCPVDERADNRIHHTCPLQWRESRGREPGRRGETQRWRLSDATTKQRLARRALPSSSAIAGRLAPPPASPWTPTLDQ